MIAFVACSLLPAAMGGKTKVDPNAPIDRRSVWRPGDKALKELKKQLLDGKGTKKSLLAIMEENETPEESLRFSWYFPTEPAYLSEIEPPRSADGFAVGVVTFPFRSSASKTFVIFNANPKIIDVSDTTLLNNIDIASSKDFSKLGDASLKAQCVWSQPLGYDVEPGAKGGMEVEVSYPINDVKTGKSIGKAFVIFEISDPGRKFSGTRLDFIEKNPD
jgi:hypothetical protein